MIVYFYGHEISLPFEPETVNDEAMSVTNILDYEYVLEYQGKDVIIDKGKSKTMGGIKAITVAKHLTTQYCTDKQIDLVSPKVIPLFKKILGVETVDYSKYKVAELKELARNRGIDLYKKQGAKKLEKTRSDLIEELSIF